MGRPGRSPSGAAAIGTPARPRLASHLSGAFGGFLGHPRPSEAEPCLGKGLNVRIRLLLAKGVPICKGYARPFPATLCCAPSLLLAGAHDAFSGDSRPLHEPDSASVDGRRLCHLCATWQTLRTSRSCDRRPGDRRLLIRDLYTLIRSKAGASDSDMVAFGGRWKG